MKRLFLIFALALPAFATNYTVKSGGGGSFTTIQACATAMAAGDTCTVFAATYNENVTVSAGTVGNYKTLTVNGSDAVIVHSFTIGSHVKVNGFQIQNPSSPTNAPCITTNGNITDFFVTNNNLYACGPYPYKEPSGNTTDHGYIQGNTISYSCSTSSSPNVCTGMLINGNYHLIENNDISHVADGIYLNGQHNVVRKNTMHDVDTDTDCGSQSSNCHIDFMQLDTSGGPSGGPIQYTLIENNTVTNMVSSTGEVHAIGLFQEDSCAGKCGFAIVRFHKASHIDGGGLFNDTGNWPNLKTYNNSYVDINRHLNASGELFSTFTAGLSASSINDIYYFTVALNGFANYGYNGTTSPSANYGHSLAFCTSTGCTTIYSHIYGSGAWLSDPGNLTADPVFVNYSTNNFNLQATSPAIAVGTYLTTVAAGDSGTGTSLVLNDASYFQDNPGSLTGVQPDCISITITTNHVCIAVASINYATNTLSLVSAVPRTPGDHVWIYSISDGTVVLNVAGPDMGAFPFAAGIATTPSCSPGTGTYSSTQTVTCTNPNGGTAVLCYTVNGATPATNGDGSTCATGTKYTTTISIATSKTLQVIAGTSTLTDSAVVPYAYLIPIATTYVNGSTGNDAYDCGSATFVSAYVGPCLTPVRGALAGTAGATINIAAGKYVLSTALSSTAGNIVAKNSQTFTGPACVPTSSPCTAIMSGGIQLCIGIYTCSGPDGNGNWSVTGMTQQGIATQPTSVCDTGWTGCIYPEDLFVNGVPLQHINSVSLPALTSTTWWFDYTNHIIYFHTNPSGKTVETSVLETMFNRTGPYPNNVTVKNLTIEEFAAPLLSGAIQPFYTTAANTSGLNWTLQTDYITLNHGTGVACAFGEHVLNNVITLNGNVGVGGGCPTTAGLIPSGLVIQGNTITANNYAHISPGFGAGGIKYGNTAGAVIRGNVVSNNIGNGIHFDMNSINNLVDGNTVEGNLDTAATGGSGYGIICEISQGCTLRNNYVQFEGTGGAVGLYSSTSTNVLAYCNVVEQTSGTNIIWAVGAATRGNRLVAPNVGTQNVSTGNDFLYNTIIWDSGTTGTVGYFQNDTTNQPNFFANNTAPDFNTYHNASTGITKFVYDGTNSGANTPLNFTTYQGHGADVHGTIDAVYTSGFPTVAITSPADQATVPSPTTIAATASDGSGIASVKFYVDWTLAATVSSAPYTYSWPANSGSHVIAALALANSGVRNCNAVTLTGTGGTHYQVTITENILTTSDALTRKGAYNQGLSDTLSTSAPLSVSFAGNISLAEDLTTTDVVAALVFGARVSLSDSVTTSDALSRIPVYKQALSDSLSTSASMTTSSAANVTISEALTTSDVMAVTGNFVLALSETLTTSDVLLQQNTFQVLSDSLTTSEILVAVHGSQTVVPGSPSNLLGTVH